LEKIFQVKDKWTFKELQRYLVEFCEPDIQKKFDMWLMKNTRTVKEPNAFNDKLTTQLYVKMF
jgi:predicted DNA-binding protein (UPF0278 family)